MQTIEALNQCSLRVLIQSSLQSLIVSSVLTLSHNPSLAVSLTLSHSEVSLQSSVSFHWNREIIGFLGYQLVVQTIQIPVL